MFSPRHLWGAVIVALSLSVAAAASAEELTIATLAPKQSAWGKVFNAWSKAVKKKTDGKLELSFYWNGSQGDDGAVLSKIKSGQLDGATLGAEALGEIHRPVLALQLPGVFTTWQSIDRATEALYPEFRDAFDKQGFFLSSIGDVGRARLLSKGRAIRTPDDLKGMKPFSPRKSVVAPVVVSVFGLTPVRLGIPEILPALTTGRIDVLIAPALAAEQLQWAPYLDHIGDDVSGIGIGAMVLNNKKLKSLPGDVVEVMRSTGKKAGAILRRNVRELDDDAYERLSEKMTVVKLDDKQREPWKAKFAEVRKRLAQREFEPALVKRIEELGGI